MTKVLVLGGTRFFGKRLVSQWQESGAQVTIVTRGLTKDSFGNSVTRITMDREDEKQWHRIIGNDYDVVYDQICYSPDDAKIAVEALEGRIGRYIYTSSMAVYTGNDQAWSESGFDPYSYEIKMGNRAEFEYGQGKRLAEAVFYQKASFSVAAVRFPVVLGLDDYTRRMEFHIERIKSGKPIGFKNLNAKTCFIHSEQAAHFLFWLANGKLEGPVNACANGEMNWTEFFSTLEEITGQKANIVPESESLNENVSPFSQQTSRFLDASKAKRAGYEFTNLRDWFPNLISDLTQ